jgi:hypothetical protein
MASALDLSRFQRFEPLQIVGLARLAGRPVQDFPRGCEVAGFG